jgi:hypothetical protein
MRSMSDKKPTQAHQSPRHRALCLWLEIMRACAHDPSLHLSHSTCTHCVTHTVCHKHATNLCNKQNSAISNQNLYLEQGLCVKDCCVLWLCHASSHALSSFAPPVRVMRTLILVCFPSPLMDARTKILLFDLLLVVH